jgi:hypothetical protein
MAKIKSKGAKVAPAIKERVVEATVTTTKKKRVEAEAPSRKKEIAPVKESKKVKEAPSTKEGKKAKPEVKPNPLNAKFENAFVAVKVTIEKIKITDESVVIQTQDRLSAKQFGKIKSVAGKKATLTTRGESWLLTYL